MKLVNKVYNIELDIKENQVIVLSIENPTAYAGMLGELWSQYNGGEGNFILSTDNKILKISSDMECVFNIFSLDCNSKKIITKLYQELKMQSDIILQTETIKLNQELVDYFDKLLMTVSYNLKYNFDTDIVNLVKVFDVKIDEAAENLLEKIVEYLKIFSQVCGISTFVFVDLKHYLTSEELERLYEFVFYNKINLIIIEPTFTAKNNGEKNWILDNDLCIIEA